MLIVHSEKALVPDRQAFYSAVESPKRELWLESQGQIDFYDDPEAHFTGGRCCRRVLALTQIMVLLHVAMSLDGFIAGPGHDMSWTRGAEYDTSSQLADEIARSTGVVLAGRGWYKVANADEGALSRESTAAPGQRDQFSS